MNYFLNVNDGHAVVEDLEGTECPNDEAVREAALTSARALMADSDARGRCRRHWQFDVLNADRILRFRVPFSHALVPDTLRERAA